MFDIDETALALVELAEALDLHLLSPAPVMPLVGFGHLSPGRLMGLAVLSAIGG